ncbi:MAG: penicillin-binding transpeptidase domain-containing protein, partial [Rhodothermales bacterium]|nr:penicillin-binding transpeptidase domain-containing protein [Rhodothermales bacterium]
AYSTLANEGVYHEPQMILRIQDRQGNTIADFAPQGREALSASTAYTVVDMMRGVVDEGTGQRIRWKFGVREPDFAGKTGTTQESADGWFILLNPDLVAGAWVGWNDRRVAFRTSWWGQGAHNALHVVGDFARRVARSDEPGIGFSNARFEPPAGYEVPTVPVQDLGDRPAGDLLDRWEARERDRDRQPPKKEDEERRGRIGW